jgi:drug/metabolite transporter (DMT)-like permease
VSGSSRVSLAGIDFAAIEERVPPMAALVVAILAVSTSAILVEWSDAPSLVKAFYRVLFTTLVLLPIAAGRESDRAAFRRLRGRDLLVAVASGVALAVHFASWFESLRWTTVAASVTLVQSQPVFVAVGAWALLDERVTRKTVVGILVALVGMALLSGGGALFGAALGGPRPLYGNGLALLGALCYTVYVLAGRSLRQRFPLLPYVIVVYTVCAAVLLVATVARGHPLLGYETREWILFAGMAVGPGLFGHTVVNWALAHVESSVVSVSLVGEPVGSTILAAFLLAEIPTATTVVGGAVVLAGIYVTATARRRDGA